MHRQSHNLPADAASVISLQHTCKAESVVLQVDRALKTLVRMTRAGGVLKEWKEQEHNVKPAEQRVLDAKESAKRRSKRLFKLQMAAIANRQAQCVASADAQSIAWRRIMFRIGQWRHCVYLLHHQNLMLSASMIFSCLW